MNSRRKVKNIPTPPLKKKGMGGGARPDENEHIELTQEMDADEKESRRKEHKRGETLKTWGHWIILILILVMAAILLSGIVVWAWHVLAPFKWHWLDKEEQWDRLKDIMSSVFFGILLSEYSRKVFGRLFDR